MTGPSTSSAATPATAAKVKQPAGKPPPREGAAPSRAAVGAAGPLLQVKVAGFFWRFGAALVDLAILALPIGAFWWAVSDHLPEGLVAGIDFIVDMILLGDDVVHAGIAGMPLVAVVYFTLTTWLLGASPGKWVARLRVIDRQGRRPSVLQATIRSLAYVPGLLLVGLGFFWIAVDRRKRGLHDLLAGTMVVRRTMTPVGATTTAVASATSPPAAAPAASAAPTPPGPAGAAGASGSADPGVGKDPHA